MRADWVEVELGDVAEIISGKNQKDVIDENGKYPIYGSAGICGYATDYLCEAGTTIIGRKGTINKPIFTKEKFWNIDTAFGIWTGGEIDKKYLYYFCCGFDFNKLDKSTTIPSLAKRDLLKIQFPVCPLPEQRAIVAKIDELFSELDNGIANLKAAQAKLDIYRQAVLKQAFEGRWTYKKIGDVIDSLDQGWSPACEKEPAKLSEWGVIKTTAIQFGKFLQEENKRLPPNLKPRIQHEIKDKDVLITRAGPRSRVGVCCLVKSPRARLINCDKVYRVRVSKVLPEYFVLLMNSPDYLEKMESTKSGINDSGVNLKQNIFVSMQIPVPTIEEQTRIVQEIEARLSVCDKLAETIQTSLQQAEALRQSILKKAFEGRLLTETELQTCKAQADWMPAEQLLAQIKSTKAK